MTAHPSAPVDADGDGLSDTNTRDAPVRRVPWVELFVLGAALLFLVGAVGYFVGVRTSEPSSSAVDVGFLQDMTYHHDQAVQIATMTAPRATDHTVQEYAQEAIIFQRYELGQMAELLHHRRQRVPDHDPDRVAMAWMGMAMPVATMPGIASDEDLEALSSSVGEAVDRRFLELMIDHHRGGVHMAEYAAEHADDGRVREIAGIMARNQAIEVVEYQQVLDRLNRR
jgi:uncharacterized protein (DUF305 family)